MRLVHASTVALLLACLSGAALANDSAAETGAGGIRLREERRILMAKERLTISKLEPTTRGRDGLTRHQVRVSVEYEFLNEGPEDVTTEVAFPLPEYAYGVHDLVGTRRVDAFAVEVDGKRVEPIKEVRALLSDRDVTASLREAGIDIETFGGYDFDHPLRNNELVRLPKAKQDRLRELGIIGNIFGPDGPGLHPRWRAGVTYHWRQSFPARRPVHVRHEYFAVAGLAYDTVQGLAQGTVGRGFPDGCFDASLVKALGPPYQPGGESARAFYSWVTYILTTANSWKTPIRDFELLVECPQGEFVSLCWDGPVERVSPTAYRAKVKDFVPTKELSVYFLSREGTRAETRRTR
jgi:hypothetical protein